VTLAAALFVALVSVFIGRIPNPPAILLSFVIFSAFHGGLRAGLASAAIAWGYFALAFSTPGHLFRYQPDDLKRILLWAVAVPTMAVMVGSLKGRALAAERAASKEAEERFTRALHASPIGVILTRLSDDCTIDANAATLEMLGYARDEILGKKSRELGVWGSAALRSDLVTRLKAEGRVQNLDIEVRTKSGEALDLLVSVERVEVGADTCMLGFLVDMTERNQTMEALRRKDEALREGQKLEAVGRLAGGIAHDFNNLLTVIGGNASWLAETMTSPDAREVVDEISGAATRAAALTRQLLDFSRQQPETPIALDLSSAVANLVPILTRTIGETIKLSTLLDSEPNVVRANPGQIDQVIMNLVLNARDALVEGGKLSISTERVTLDDIEAALVGPQASAGRWVVLTVRDAGEGMDPKTVERIFEPFFSTKGVGRGTGLGLATVYGIVSASAGFIAVESAVGHGTAFKVFLPQIDVLPVSAAEGSAAVVGGTEVVLLVEDDASVRTLTARLLTGLGYAVLSADGAEQAIDIVSRRSGGIDLVLTDVVMPGMNGRELVDSLKSRLPATRVVFVSGYADDVELVEKLRRQEVLFLAKPFTRTALAHKLREALDAALPQELPQTSETLARVDAKSDA